MFRQLYEIILISGICLLFSCGPSRLSRQDLSQQLSSPDRRLQPDFSVIHVRDSSFLRFSISSADLLFRKQVDQFESAFSVSYLLHPSFESAAVADSSTFAFSFVRDSLQPLYKGKIHFRMHDLQQGVLRVTVTDLVLKQSVIRLIPVYRQSNALQQRMELLDTAGVALVRNYVKPAERFKIDHEQAGTSLFLVKCYFRKFPHPAPPFSNTPDPHFSIKPDSLFELDLSAQPNLNFNRPGIYYLQPDTSVRNGFTIFVFDDYFPEIKTAEQMIEPVRYLITRKEYNELTSKTDAKAAIDKFWLDFGGRSDRSRAMIRIYYQRVQEANRQFTSFVPGWKTDRGMVYTVFGPPNSVFRSRDSEQWSYSGTSMPALDFTFRRIGNPFTDNDFSLIRGKEYEYPWFRMVEQWRQGNISLRH